MFGVGDVIMYGTHGICTVIALESRCVDRRDVEYYVLEPKEQECDRFYVPTQNKAACAKMRKLLTVDEINHMLHSDTVQQDIWINDDGKRKQLYRDILAGGDRSAILCMIHTLHKHRRAQIESGRKLHMIDENFLRDAEKLLNAEFSFVLGISKDQIAQYVLDTMEAI